MWTPKPAIELSSQRAVRRHNLSIVLRQVVERGPRSRATIAQDTGLNKSTVSSLVSELMEFGLLVERGAEHRGTAGRPGLVVDVARDGVIALGLEVNVDYLGVQATDLAGGSRYKAMEAVDNRGRGVGEVFEALGALTQGALNEVQAQGLRPIGATVALPGLVDIQRGALLVAPNLHWIDVPVVELLREHIDATAAADRRRQRGQPRRAGRAVGGRRDRRTATSSTSRARSASAAGSCSAASSSAATAGSAASSATRPSRSTAARARAARAAAWRRARAWSRCWPRPV